MNLFGFVNTDVLQVIVVLNWKVWYGMPPFYSSFFQTALNVLAVGQFSKNGVRLLLLIVGPPVMLGHWVVYCKDQVLVAAISFLPSGKGWDVLVKHLPLVGSKNSTVWEKKIKKMQGSLLAGARCYRYQWENEIWARKTSLSNASKGLYAKTRHRHL